jgi:hypothetical protein
MRHYKEDDGRCGWSLEDTEALSYAYKQYPYQIPQWLIDKHGSHGCHSKSSRLGFAKNVRHPGIDMSHLSESDKGYIAGFIDGEGSIIFYKDRKILNPAILVANTDKPVLDYLKSKLTIGSLAITRRTHKNPKWKDLYQLHIHGAKPVYDILIVIEPYLIIKKEKALTAIRILKEKYNF